MLILLLACVGRDTQSTLQAAAAEAYPGLRDEVLQAALRSYRCARNGEKDIICNM